jgi:hypothetical protein
MSELRKLARQLCYRDGMAWSLSDFEKGVSGVTMLTVVADERKRREYLKRARAMLNGGSEPLNRPLGWPPSKSDKERAVSACVSPNGLGRLDRRAPQAPPSALAGEDYSSVILRLARSYIGRTEFRINATGPPAAMPRRAPFDHERAG